jgi:hypothetical protein
MRRLFIALFASAAISVVAASSVAGSGPQPGTLAEHGWTCFPVPGLGVHCSPPGRDFEAPVEHATPLLYWFDTMDPGATNADFSGTELLLPSGQYHGQPCPQEGLDEWADLGIARACHHN